MDPSERAFLQVEQSFNGQRWKERADRVQLGSAERMVEDHGVDQLVARILAGRGVPAETASEFLAPTIRDLLPNPSELTDMDAAASPMRPPALMRGPSKKPRCQAAGGPFCQAALASATRPGSFC